MLDGRAQSFSRTRECHLISQAGEGSRQGVATVVTFATSTVYEPPAAAPAPDSLLLRAADRLAEALVVTALLGELLLVLANIVARSRFQATFLWADETARLVLSILAFIGGALAYRRRDHAYVRVVLPACCSKDCRR